MAKFYLIRHGEPDYTYGDTHGFIGHGHDLAPLKQDKIKYVIETSKDPRLKNAQIIVSSPYTRALQTANIISKETGIDIVIEPDIREWQPDLTYPYKNSNELKIPLKHTLGSLPNGVKDTVIINADQLIAHDIINTSKEVYICCLHSSVSKL